MAKWGKCDFKQLKQFEKRIERLQKVDFDSFCRELSKEITAMLLSKVIKRTPTGKKPKFEGKKTAKVQGESGKSKSFLTAKGAAFEEAWAGYKGGTLKRAWTILPIEKKGGNYTVTIVNNTEYASYVEYGHRQTPGRYVPALGKSLKQGWAPGVFMMTMSEQEIKKQAPVIIEKRLYTLLKEVF